MARAVAPSHEPISTIMERLLACSASQVSSSVRSWEEYSEIASAALMSTAFIHDLHVGSYERLRLGRAERIASSAQHAHASGSPCNHREKRGFRRNGAEFAVAA